MVSSFPSDCDRVPGTDFLPCAPQTCSDSGRSLSKICYLQRLPTASAILAKVSTAFSTLPKLPG